MRQPADMSSLGIRISLRFTTTVWSRRFSHFLTYLKREHIRDTRRCYEWMSEGNHAAAVLFRRIGNKRLFAQTPYAVWATSNAPGKLDYFVRPNTVTVLYAGT